MEDGWSTKKLIRTIVLSRSYQLSSSCEANRLLEADPAHVLAGRHRRRRLDAESLRDRILQAGGTLDPEPAQGSAIDDLDILLNWPPGEAKYLHEPSNHRSVYLCTLRNAPPLELVALLDRARRWSERTAGAFDVTVQPLWTLYRDHFAAAEQKGAR